MTPEQDSEEGGGEEGGPASTGGRAPSIKKMMLSPQMKDQKPKKV
jgi:hypothetical protein